MAGHRVFDYADNACDDGACYAAADGLAEQLADIDAARRALQNGQQCGEQRASARAAKCAGDGVAQCAEIEILDSGAGRIAPDRTRNKLIGLISVADMVAPSLVSDGLFRPLPSFPAKHQAGIF